MSGSSYRNESVNVTESLLSIVSADYGLNGGIICVLVFFKESRQRKCHTVDDTCKFGNWRF